MKNIITEYPYWAWILCPLLGLAFAALLYVRNRRTAEMGTPLAITLAVLRFSTVTILAFLLLGPLIKYLDVTVEPPVIAIAADNSSSVVLEGDTARRSQRSQAVRQLLSELHAEVGESYEVSTYTFGQEVREGFDPDFTEPVTDMAQLFASLKTRYANRNLGAIIVATDGIYNRGSNPVYSTTGLKVPVYTIALGDTTVKRDLRIDETGSNRIAFLNNKFPIEARIEADKLAGHALRFTISEGGEILFDESVDADGDNFTHTFRGLLEADSPGLHHYRLRVSTDVEETTLANNTRSVFVEVIDSRRKVLILADAPHPDVAALRHAIESNRNYEVIARVADAFDQNLEDFDLIITHNIPGQSTEGREIAQRLADSELPFWAIAGLGIDPARWQNMPTAVSFAGGAVKSNDVQGVVNPNFAGFSLPEDLDALLREAPPVQAPFGAQISGPAGRAVIYQRVGPVDTEDPLLVTREVGGRRTATFVGEGLWRWRLFNFATEENHEVFDALVNGVVQYLAIKEDKRYFRVASKDAYMENERIILTAELYDESYEPVTDREVKVSITDEDGRVYPFVFAPSGTTYRLDAGILPVGTYSYTARVSRAGKEYVDSGRFIIRSFALESARLTADHDLLRAISVQTGGEMFAPGEVSDLVAELQTEEGRLQPTSYTTQVLRSILEFKWIFFLLVALLAIEWFSRKRAGFY